MWRTRSLRKRSMRLSWSILRYVTIRRFWSRNWREKMSSVFYEMAKKNYMKGLWNRAMIDHLLKIGRLTQEEHDDIVGVENE